MKPARLLFAAHDPGGANVLRTVIEHFAGRGGCVLVLALLGPARERIRIERPNVCRARLPVTATPDFPNEQSTTPAAVSALFREHRFDWVLTATSYNSNLERLVLAEARTHGIPAAAIIDFWSGYVSRFTLDSRLVYPDVLFVTDAKMARELEATAPPAAIVTAGNPHLRELAESHAATPAPARETDQAPVIRFFSENIRHYFPDRPLHEFAIVEKILHFLADRAIPCRLLVRPHPMESPEPWLDFFKRMTAQNLGGIITLALDTLPLPQVLAEHFVAVGITSMVLLETAVCGIPTFSYQIGVPDDGYLFLPYEEYGIERLKREDDLARLLRRETRGTLPAGQFPGIDPLTVIQTTMDRMAHGPGKENIMDPRDIFLEGETVALKALTEDDVRDSGWHGWFNNRETTAFMQQGYFPNTREAQLEFLKKEVLHNPGKIQLGIVVKSEQRLIGVVSLSGIDFLNRKAEFAIVIGEKDCRGKEYGTEATRLILEHAFGKLSLNKVWLGVHAGHAAAIRTYEKAGFIPEGTLREEILHAGAYYNVVRMSILARDFFTGAGRSNPPAADPIPS